MEGKKKIEHDFDFIGRILAILKILQEETDEETSISQSDILRRMREHEKPCSERTLMDYLKVIMNELNPEEADGYVDEKFTIADYKIIARGLEDKLRARDLGLTKEGEKKLQLRGLKYNHVFSFEELNQIVEAILFLKNIDNDKKEDLIRKLQTLSSVNYPKHSPFISETSGKISTYVSGVFENSRIDEKVVRDNLKQIRQAIEGNNGRGYKISFVFNTYNEEKKLTSNKNEQGEVITYVANPYYVILYNGKYYLICNIEPFSNVSFFRIDLMSNISDKTKISPIDEEKNISEPRKAKRDVKGLPMEWNAESAYKFQSEHLYMFYGETKKITIKIDRERYTLLHDFFGEHFQFIKHIDERWDEIVVESVPKAMESWAMQCSDFVEILEPIDLRRQVQMKCEALMARYKVEENGE